MKLINTTNSHATLVKSQLESTDATLVIVYSAGNTDVVFTKKLLPLRIARSVTNTVLFVNEVELIAVLLKRKIDLQNIDQSAIKPLLR